MPLLTHYKIFVSTFEAGTLLLLENEKLSGLKASYDRQMRWFYRIKRLLIAGFVILLILAAAVIISRIPAPMPDAPMTMSEALQKYGPDAPKSWFQRTMEAYDAINFTACTTVMYMIAIGTAIYSVIRSTRHQPYI